MIPLVGSGVAEANSQAERTNNNEIFGTETQYARVPFNPTEESNTTSEPKIQPRTAEGMSWAPGGAGAYNDLLVRGNGTYVTSARVAYFGGVPTVNVCADTFEIAYYEKGGRKVETHNGHCGVGRITSTFEINRHLDHDKPFCSRIKASGQWSNYACVQIKR